jgi:hypothetical protein
LTITGWSPLYIYAISLILSVVGVFFFVSLFPLLGLSPENRKSLLVLPIGMLLFTSLGIPVAYYLVPGSPIDLQYHLAHEIILSAYYRPLFMGAIGIFLSLVYIILYRKLYRRIPLSFLTELTSLSRRDFWYPGLLFVISIVLGFMVIL